VKKPITSAITIEIPAKEIVIKVALSRDGNESIMIVKSIHPPPL